MEAPADSIEFMKRGRIRVEAMDGATAPGIVVGPNAEGSEILIAASLLAPQGKHRVRLVASGDSSEAERFAAIDVTVRPLPTVPAGASRPPVVLLNGWRPSLGGICLLSSDAGETFGTLERDLRADGVPQVYFFNNCTIAPEDLIESLGNKLGEALAQIRYDTGQPVTRFDLIGHSMGGLIARSYLVGLQSDGSLRPPADHKVRKLIQIATPNFGAYLAEGWGWLGPQTNQLIPGSPFLWNLATWNQGGDDLRGVEALAIVGAGGSKGGSGSPPARGGDGVVSISSAALGFTRPSSYTRILPYCHIEPGFAQGFTDCSGPGIAKEAETIAIVRSFLAGTTAWQSTPSTHLPTQDEYLSRFGGMYYATQTSTGQWVSDVSGVSFGTVPLRQGRAQGTVYYHEFVSGTDTFKAISSSHGTLSCGPVRQSAGYYNVWRCKFSPVISAVLPRVSGTDAVLVPSGGMITISGVGFGQECASCGVWAYPGGLKLQVGAWGDQTITASLPSSYSGLVTLVLQASNGTDRINIMAAPPQPAPLISLSSPTLGFVYTAGNAAPVPQLVQISNTGGGTLNWTASTNAAWLNVSPTSGTAPSSLSIFVLPSGLAPGTYTGTVTVNASGASNSPRFITVTLTVSALPLLSVTPESLTFTYASGGTLPPEQSLFISNAGAGSLTWTANKSAAWLTLSQSSGTTPSTVAVSLVPSLQVPGTYVADIIVTSGTGSSKRVSVTLAVTAPQPQVTISSVVNGASFAPGICPGSWVTITGANLSASQRTWRADEIVNGRLPVSLDGVTVSIGGQPAFVHFVSPTQLNVQAPTPSAVLDGQSILVQVNSPLGSAAATAQWRVPSPAMFKVDSRTAAAVHLDGSMVAALGAFPGSRPAKPGDTIQVFATGLGDTNPRVSAGQVVQTPSAVQGQVTASVCGLPAAVGFAGLVGPGLYQVNMTIPPVGQTECQLALQVGATPSQNTAALAIER